MYEPELGQMAFSNSPWEVHEMQDFVENGLRLLSNYIPCDVGYSELMSPMQNSGAEFSNDVFSAKSYCWCDGEQGDHKEGCPPNFKCGDFEARWYKYLGRGSSQNKILTENEWKKIIMECLNSVK